MDKDLIFIDVMTFTNKAHIYIYKNGTEQSQSCPLDKLAETVNMLCATYKINDVKMSGSKQFLTNYVKDIQELNKQTYSNFDLMIEVIPV